MRKRCLLANAVLWAAALLAAAHSTAPVFLSLVLLPMLATLSLLTLGPDAYLNRSDIS